MVHVWRSDNNFCKSFLSLYLIQKNKQTTKKIKKQQENKKTCFTPCCPVPKRVAESISFTESFSGAIGTWKEGKVRDF